MTDTQARILDRIAAAGAPFSFVIAPPGFGKTRLAQAFALGSPAAHYLTVADRSAAAAAIREVEAVLQSAAPPTRLVLDAAERFEEHDFKKTLAMLAARRGPATSVMICARAEPRSFQFSDVIAPHLIAVLRRADLEMTLSEFRTQAPQGGGFSVASIYRAHYLTRGWPVPALSLINATARGAFEGDPIRLDHPALNDLLDWLDANVYAPLSPELRRALLRCVACRDLTPAGFDRMDPDSDEHYDRQLYRTLQLADIGYAGEIRLHPLLEFFAHARCAAELDVEARAAARYFLEQGAPVRAARAFIDVRDAKAAADVLATVSFDDRRDLGGYAYPGLILDHYGPKPLYEHYPAVWLNLLPSRFFLDAPASLAREGEAILQIGADELPLRERYWIIAIVAFLFAEAGDLARAQAHALKIVAPVNGDVETTMSYEIAALCIDLHEGRYRSVFERWKRAGPHLLRFPAWHGLILRSVIGAAFGLGDFEAVEQALRTQLSLARSGGAPSLVASGPVEGAFLAWRRGDTASRERYRGELGRIAQYYDVPQLWRYIAALFGNDLDDRMAHPQYGAYADLMLAAESKDAGGASALTQRAVDSADRSEIPLLRVESRILAAERDVAGRERWLREAAEIAAATDSEMLKASVGAVPAASPVGPVARPPEGRLIVDVASGEVSRDGSAVDVSEGTRALLVMLAVASRPVRREAVADRMWPDQDADAAANALKMCVHRARTQLGDPSATNGSNGS